MQGRSFLRKTGFTYQMHSFLKCIFPQIVTDSFSLARNDSTVKLKRLHRASLADLRLLHCFLIFSTFKFFIFVFGLPIYRYSFYCEIPCSTVLSVVPLSPLFRVPILTYRHFGTYSGLSRASDSEFWLYFAFKNPPKVCFLTIHLLSSAIIFNRVFSIFFFFNSVSSQLYIRRL